MTNLVKWKNFKLNFIVPEDIDLPSQFSQIKITIRHLACECGVPGWSVGSLCHSVIDFDMHVGLAPRLVHCLYSSPIYVLLKIIATSATSAFCGFLQRGTFGWIPTLVDTCHVDAPASVHR